MDTQQAQQLAAEADALCERLAAAACAACKAGDRKEEARIMTIRRQAVRRWGRRLDKWSVATYGPGGVK